MDSNVPMYLVGAEHPNKHAARRILERLIAGSERIVTDAEVLQEILRRYVAIRRRDAIGPCFEALLGIADEVFPVELEDTLAARDLVGVSERISARDALHAAVMRRYGVRKILTFDVGFDALPDIERVAE